MTARPTTVVFDIGNVLLQWDPRNLYRKLFGGRDEEMEWFLANVCSPAWNIEQDRGRSFADAVAALIAEHPPTLHPMIRAESERQIAAAGGPYVLHVVPLLVESGGTRERVDRVLVVDCPEEIQVERVRARSGLSDEEAQAIVRAQAPRAARLAAADDVIDNSGTLDELRRQVAVLHARYAEMAKTARS